MPISFFDLTVTPESQENPTPGVLIAETISSPRYASGSTVWVVLYTLGIVSNQQIPVAYIQNGETAYITRLILQTSRSIQTELRLGSSNSASGASAGPSFLAAKLSSIGIAVQDGDGTVVSLMLSELNDSTEPYQGNLALAGVANLSGSLRYVIVDTSNPNVDWTNKQFLSVSAAADVRVQDEFRHEIRGETNVTITPVVDERVQLELSHEIRGVSNLLITPPEPVRVQLNLEYDIRGSSRLIVYTPIIVRPVGPTGYSFEIDEYIAATNSVGNLVVLERITEFSGINEETVTTDLTFLGHTIKNEGSINLSQFERIMLRGYVDLMANGVVDPTSAFARIGRPARRVRYPGRTFRVTHRLGLSQSIEVFPVRNKLITSSDDDVMFDAELAIAAKSRADYVEVGF